MINWFKRNKENRADGMGNDGETTLDEGLSAQADEGFLSRLKRGLIRTRHQLGDGLARLLLGKKELNPELLETLETLLIRADLGVDATNAIVQSLTGQLSRNALADGDAVYNELRQQMTTMLSNHQGRPLTLETSDASPFVILMVGVNGAGKTTTIGKLAKQYQAMGKSVLLAAGDTFRAAAVEQLQTWGTRNQIPVIAQHTGADSASVIFDAISAAKARKVDIVIADTAGRLHTQHNLMDELRKIKRVMQKIDPRAPHEVMLVLDASIGQNALNQAREFNQAVGVTGITMTKLDGTAKGGILVAISNELRIPFRYIGIGEGIDDLKPFEATDFVDAILHD